MATTTPTAPATAVIQTGGKQYLVKPGSVIRVEKLEAAVGDTVSFDSVVATGPDGLLSAAALQVSATVVEQGKGKKIRVSTYKSKKRVRRTLGHRQLFSALRIMAVGSVKATAAKS